MKKLFVFCAATLLLSLEIAGAQIPGTMSYQGVLTDRDGKPMPDGTQEFTCSIYSQETGGIALWTETQETATTGGAFSLILGKDKSIELKFDGKYWLGVRVNNDPELPRIELTPVPYAFRAKIAESVKDGSVSSAQLAGDAVTSLKIEDGEVGTGDLADDAVTSAKVKDGELTDVDIASGAAIAVSKISGLGSAAIENVGTGANQVVQLDGNARLPAVDGSALTDIAATSIADGAVTSAKVKDGEIGTGDLADNAVTSAKVKDGEIGTGDLAANAVTSAKIADGTIANADISSAAAIAVSKISGLGSAATQNVGTDANQVVQLDGSAKLPAVDGSALTDIAARSIADDAVTSAKVKDGEIGTGDLAANAVTSAKIADGEIVDADIATGAAIAVSKISGLGTAATENVGTAANQVVQLDGSAKLPAVDGSALTNVPATSIADDAVTSAKIADGAIVGADLANSAVTSAKVADGTIIEGDLANSAVTTAKIADGEIVDADIAPTAAIAVGKISGLGTAAIQNVGTGPNQVVQLDGAGKLPAVDGSALTNVGTASIANGTIAADDLAANTVTSAKIADGEIVNADIASGAGIAVSKINGLGNAAIQNVGTSAFQVVQLDGSAKLPAVDGSALTNVAATSIAANAVTSAKIADGTIVETDLANNAVTSAKIADGTIVETDLANSAVTSAKIADGEIADADIATGAAIAVSKISGLGTAATENVGTSAYQVVQLDGSARLPAVDGSALTNIGTASIVNGSIVVDDLAADAVTSAKIADGEIVDADIASGAAIAVSKISGLGTAATENVGTSANQIVQLDGSARLPAVDGSALTNVAATSIAANTVTSAKIADGTIVETDLAADAVTSAKIADGQVMTGDILDGTIVEADLANSAVTSAKIADGTIVETDLAADAVTSAKIADGQVMTGDILDGTIVEADLANSAVTSAKIADGEIVDADISPAAAIAVSKISGLGTAAIIDVGTGANQVVQLDGTSKLPAVDGSALTNIGTASIVDGTIVVGDLAANAVTSAKITDGTIVEADLAANAATSAKIADGTIVEADLANNAITSAKIADGQVATGDILDGTIVEADLANNAVTTAKIADGTIVEADLANSAVTSAKIADGEIVDADIAVGAAIDVSKLNGVARTGSANTFTGDQTVNGDLSVTDVTASGRVKDKSGYLAPVGTVNMFAGSSAPEGWLICDGSAVSSATYPDLYAVIGTTYGGNESNFNLPNMKGKVPVGLDTGDADFNALNNTGGAKTHALTTAEMPAHNHTADPPNTSTTTNGSHTHTYWKHYTQVVEETYGEGSGYGHVGWITQSSPQTDAAGNHAHTVDIPQFNSGTTGSGTAHNNLQPYIALNYIIKY